MKKLGYILGRRIRGDVLLDNDPITNAPGRLWGPAVHITGIDQFYDEESEDQNYTLGSRMLVDQRTFHYAKAGHAIPDGIGVNYLAVMTEPLSDIFLNPAAPNRVIGDTTLAITVGGFQNSVVVADELIGAFIEIWPVGGFLEWRRIIGNTASDPADAGGVFTITVDRPFLHDLPFATTGCLIHPNIYRATMYAPDAIAHGCHAGFTVAVGLPPIAVPLDHYYWLQTYGPCCIGPVAGFPLEVGVPYFVDVYMECTTGAVASALHMTIGVAGTPSPQRVGYALGAEDIGTLQIMLQLAP